MAAINSLSPSIDTNSARLLVDATPSVSTTANEDKLKKAAQGFERTLIRQMLSTVRSTNLRGTDETSDTSKSYLEIMDDHVADMLSRGNGIGFANKMAQQLIQQANAAKLIGSSEIAVKPLNAPREATVSAETLKSLQRPDGFLGTAK
jgi:Rod binding domain-containing protein